MSNSGNQDAHRTELFGFNQFAAEFYKALSENEEKSYVCSPFSALIVLFLTSFGARGLTKQQFRSILHLSSDDYDEIEEDIKQRRNSVVHITGVEFCLENNIFIDQSFDIDAEFAVSIEVVLRCSLEDFDFRRRPDEAAEKINDWVKETTNGRIENIVAPSYFGLNTGLVLISVGYFEGEWKKGFNPDLTKERPFRVDETTEKYVPTMYAETEYNCGDITNLNARYIELPYKHGDNIGCAYTDVSMFVILPNDINGLSHIANNINDIDFKELHDRGSLNTTQVELHLPKFKIQSELDLEKPLRKMGLDIFGESTDIGNIAATSHLMVTKFIQKLYLNVDEKGGEATTANELDQSCVPPTIRFIVNKPFFCTIVSLPRGTQMFTARIIDPQ